MDTNTKKIFSYIKENEMVQAGDMVCVGFSGGPDSLCLLQILFELKEPLGISLSAFHVNHCLRGAESDEDQSFAEKFCKEREIPFRSFRYDVQAAARERGRGTEEAGRAVRREAAQACLREDFGTKIALAHHIGDRAETLLFNLARGTSVSGLKGMLPVNGNVIRPLLCLTRQEILELLESRGLAGRVDKTNLEDTYARNKLRLHVLPYLEEEINRESARHIAAAARDMEDADALLRELAAQKKALYTEKRGDDVLIKQGLLTENRLLAGYILLDALKALTGTALDLTRGHAEDIRRLLENQSGRVLDLPYGLCARRVYEGVLLQKKAEKEATEQPEIPLAGEGTLRFQNAVFHCRLLPGPAAEAEIPKKRYTKWFDYDKLSKCCVFRQRRAGDYLVIDEAQHKKKLKQYLIDEKVPAQERSELICLADGPEILWVVGHRIGWSCKVTKETKRILEIRKEEENPHEL